MRISPYFRNLLSAYNAELDDLSTDSEGRYVLPKRLTQRRGELTFLAHMLEISPEMVAVVLHKGFRFPRVAALWDLVGRESDELPDWDELAAALQLEPWALPLVQALRQQPQGDWFLCVAAGLEFLHTRHEHTHDEPADLAAEDAEAAGSQRPGRSSDDAFEPLSDEAREEAGADWMAEQGFDRKE